MLDDVIVRSIMDTFSDNLLIGISSSLTTTRLNLVSSSSRDLAPIELSYIRFYFELYVLKLSINIILLIIILF